MQYAVTMTDYLLRPYSGRAMRAFALGTTLLVGLMSLPMQPAYAQQLQADVVRFHNGFTAQGQVIRLEPDDPGLAASLEYQSYAEALGARLAKLGFKPAGGENGAPQLVGVIAYKSVVEASSAPARSPVSIGVGVGGGSRNVGVSLGTSFGLGTPATRDVRVNSLSFTLKSAQDGQVVWEGRATNEQRDTPNAAPTQAIPQLMDALLSDFPGLSGKTTRYRAPKAPAASR
jgi:hypothetical protein